MAAPRTALMRLAIVTMLIEMTMAATYTVGGPNGGWDATTDLKTWTSSQTFLVGDNLNFQYGPSHNVIEVPKADYDACTSSNSIQLYSDGSDTIPLSSPGKRYFICGVPGHCSQGMKLEVTTLARTSAAPTAAIISPAPLDSPSISSPSSTETPAPESSSTNASPAESPASPGSNPTEIPSTEAPTSISRTGSSPQPSASSLNCKLSGVTVGFSVVIMLFVAPLRF